MYVTKSGDTWDGIAYLLYQNEEYAKDLIALNRKYSNVVIFSAGVVLKTIELGYEATDDIPPWKR